MYHSIVERYAKNVVTDFYLVDYFTSVIMNWQLHRISPSIS